MKEIQYCSICGVSEKDTKFFKNGKYGTNLCNKHWMQMKYHNKITDSSQPDMNDKRIYWTPEEEIKLRELVEVVMPYKEMAKILNKSPMAIRDKVGHLKLETQFKNSVKYKAIYQDYDWCYQKYIIEGLSHDEMALEANAKKRVVEKWCAEKHRLTRGYRKANKQLSEIQKDLIIGSMLGDGHIDKRETQPMFIESHAENQKDYLYFKYAILEDLCNQPPIRKEACYSPFNGKLYLCQPAYRFCTRLCDCLLEYRGKSYSHLLNLINEFSFSIWMLDDGYRSNSNWELCVAEYKQEDVILAIDILKNKYNLTSRLKKDIRYLYFDAKSSREIDKIILRNIPNELDIIKYKITENNICQEEKRVYIEFDNEKILLAEFCKTYDLNYKSTWGRIFKNNQSIESILEVIT